MAGRLWGSGQGVPFGLGPDRVEGAVGGSLLALLTAHTAGTDTSAGGTGGGSAHHHVAAAGGTADSGADSRGSTGGAEIATDDATTGAADA